MTKYLFIESNEGNEYLKSEFEEYTSPAQRQAIWGALDQNDSEAVSEILNSIETLKGQDITILSYELDEHTMSALYSQDMIDYDADKARGFVKVD